MYRYSRTSYISITAIFITGLLLAGCGKSTEVKSEAAPADVAAAEASLPPLKIAYSDWPGWIAWDIGIQKGFFKEEGVAVDFRWFEYAPSMEAFAAGQVDAVTMTNGDALITGATGAPSVIILVNDYSDGNDMIVAQQGIASVAELKGKKIGIEVGFVEHLLLLTALEKNGLTEKDVTLVNTPTHQTAQTLASGDVNAIAAWQPNSGQALKAVAGSKAIFSSADEPGLIYDTLAVKPDSLAKRTDDWKKVVKVWYRIVDFMSNPSNRKEMLEILSARVNISPEEYEPFLKGTRILTYDEAKKVFEKGDGFGSLYGSSKVSDDFYRKYDVYKDAQKIDQYIDGSLMTAIR
jgi:NitT/TauT family transport system substrate-binding protein